MLHTAITIFQSNCYQHLWTPGPINKSITQHHSLNQCWLDLQLPLLFISALTITQATTYTFSQDSISSYGNPRHFNIFQVKLWRRRNLGYGDERWVRTRFSGVRDSVEEENKLRAKRLYFSKWLRVLLLMRSNGVYTSKFWTIMKWSTWSSHAQF